MTSIVSVARYRLVTHDTSTPEVQVSAALVEAQTQVEEHLHRPLARAETTERLPVYKRPCAGLSAFPRRIPIASVPTGVGYIIGTSVRLDSVGFPALDPVIEGWQTGRNDTTLVTFTGGWYGRDDPAADLELDALPVTLERAICRVAHGITVNAPSMLAGVKRAQVGTVLVEFAGDGTDLDAFAPGVTLSLKGYGYRPVT